MSFISEMQRLQRNIQELSQTFEALKETVDRLDVPEYPNQLREPEEDLFSEAQRLQRNIQELSLTLDPVSKDE